ncbi:toxin ParE1/3/4 [Rhizobium sp. SG_E_25_P2]|uniref:type II toxin-antitoxin system RelE/ParE family toxin n=1 Tax=Rhizobium sp. SG_E_25_P2 TaxID=2879942 RepID=UPI0024763AA2|nr:type II toxin-antitoxin system RelE/ParE family toxin [Rhizobium sp. SG_E_25_P2]MDH6267185.1 toxin ParE1/3/4 [Rhizobium sp. SG_E_25_P2]
MPDVVLSPKAEDDLREIWLSIAVHNEAAADKLILRLFAKMKLASDHPHIGPQKAELGEKTRFLTVGDYIILYEPRDDEIFVASIVYGGRDVQNRL